MNCKWNLSLKLTAFNFEEASAFDLLSRKTLSQSLFLWSAINMRRLRLGSLTIIISIIIREEEFLHMLQLLITTKMILLLLIIIPNFLQTSYGKQTDVPLPNCIPSSCGNIHNISFPFRLRDDPKHCGDPSYQLECQNNTAFLYFNNSQKYLVREINYDNYTIRLSDASIKTDTACSFPEYSLSVFPQGYPYSNYQPMGRYLNHVVAFISCPHPVSSSLFLETTECFNNSRTRRYTYMNHHGYFVSQQHELHMCRTDVTVMTSLPLPVDENGEERNASLSDIHRALLYGFELSWFNALCPEKCKYSGNCHLKGTAARCFSGYVYCFLHYQSWQIQCYAYTRELPDWLHKSLPWINRTLQISTVFVVLQLAGRILIGMPFMLGLLIYKLRRRHLSMIEGIEGFLQSNNNLMPIRYSYSNIKQITRNLKEKLGEGGYGSVYKGKLRSGHDVAVKVLNNKRGATGQDFINEIATIGRIHHINVVKLVGYCVQGSKCALIYDFMPKGSLEKYIYRDERASNSLSWKQKYEIAVGVARGIEYLHRGCNIQILHFDIKPHNILLDDGFTPKVSDFGLAKFYPTDNVTVTLTMARGTIGYVAPELINRSIGRVSYKADVYSFGMLMMEMLHLNRDMVADDDKSSQYFPYWIYDRFNKGKDIKTGNADEIDEEDDDFARKVKRKMTIVGLWCIRMSPEDRPSMSEVVKMLERENENLEIPPLSSQSDQVAAKGDQSWGTESTDSIALLGTSYASSEVSG